MAPRARTKKRGLMRMDAAIDALTPMGYSRKFVRSKVNELLKVYGEEGWSFIEEGSYSTLIDYILKESEEGPYELGQSCSQALAIGGSDQAIVEATPREAEPSHGQSTVKVKPMEAESSDEPAEPSLCCLKETALLSPVTVLSPRGFESFCLTPAEAIRKRKPCLGWIGLKNDEDYVLLEPAPVQSWKVSSRRRKRKSRWDVGPNDTE